MAISWRAPSCMTFASTLGRRVNDRFGVFTLPARVDATGGSRFSVRGAHKKVETRSYPSEFLQRYTTSVFKKLGIPDEDAALASTVLAASDLRGIDSHGVARLRTYVELLQAGRINKTPKLKILRQSPSTASVDGDNGLGLVVGPRANEIAMQKAVQAGSGWVSVSNTNHFGIAGWYAQQGLGRDLIGWAMTNSTKLVVPFRGAEPMLGTNPIAVAFPGKEEPAITIDMATSAVAYGKVEIAYRKHKRMPHGWGVDSEGRSTTDPADVINGGALVPLGSDAERGGHKGYCLAVLADVLCCVLSGANWGPFAPPFTLARQLDAKMGSVGKGIGHYFGAMRIDGFIEPDEFKRQIDEYRRVFKKSRPAVGNPAVILPGDPEIEQEKIRRVHGVPLVMPVVEELRHISKSVGVPFD